MQTREPMSDFFKIKLYIMTTLHIIGIILIFFNIILYVAITINKYKHDDDYTGYLAAVFGWSCALLLMF